jgi:cellobiose epimerase
MTLLKKTKDTKQNFNPKLVLPLIIMKKVKELEQCKSEIEQELTNILDFWAKHSIDKENGGFYGKIDETNNVIANAEKGSVLNARILWTFSAAYLHSNKKEYLDIANRAYEYLLESFNDKNFDGLYWSVDFDAKPLNTRKQVYGQAFAIYALSEYFKINQKKEVLDWAIELFELIEKHSFDQINDGYLEAFKADWSPIEDLKLSKKDANEKKSMNTHLHILEAYSNLYFIWPSDRLHEKLKSIINVFFDKIIDPITFHQQLFFDEQWHVKSDIISFGHDIEASWLIHEAALAVKNEPMIEHSKYIAINIANATLAGFDANWGLTYEIENGHHDTDKHWWVQAEAMVGLLNAYQLSDNDLYLQAFIKNWSFIKKYIINPTGEWFWGVQGDQYTPMPNQDKIGFWKCPYHNVRACLEVLKRI